ncbi:hypothetical protein ACFP81_12035 [Deinococcus lacus]|uniref:Uncharacterized protein n=1 Tax=Deinococcus lacus TaxID=392561 RepID=A0ABW1YE92_9DEIO
MLALLPLVGTAQSRAEQRRLAVAAGRRLGLLLWLWQGRARVYGASPEGTERQAQAFWQSVADLPFPFSEHRLALSGSDLRSLLGPEAEVGTLKRWLTDAVIAGDLPNDSAALSAAVRSRVALEGVEE